MTMAGSAPDVCECDSFHLNLPLLQSDQNVNWKLRPSRTKAALFILDSFQFCLRRTASSRAAPPPPPSTTPKTNTPGMGTDDDGVPPSGRMTNRDPRPATGQGASHSFQANLANRFIRPVKSVKAMVSLFERPSPSGSIKGDEVGMTSPESTSIPSAAPQAESSTGQHSGKKTEKALAATSDGPEEQLSILMEQLDRFAVDENSPAAPPQQQEVELEQTERRDPEEVKKFWANVRAQLWIDDDELEDPPAFDEGGETANNVSQDIVGSTDSTVVWGGSNLKTPRKPTEPVAPPDSSFPPESPFGTGPVLKSLKEYYDKNENEPLQPDSPQTAVQMTFGNRVIDPSLVPRPLRTPSRGGFATSSTLPSIGSAGSFAMSSPTPTPYSRTHPVQSSPTIPGQVIGDILTQFPATARQYPPRPARQMGSSPPTMALSDYRSDDEKSVYSQEEQQFGSSPPPPPIPPRSPLRPLPPEGLFPPTVAGRHGNQLAPSSSHLSIDQYSYLFKEPEAQGNPSSQMTLQVPGNTQQVVRTESIGSRRWPHTRFPRIDTSLANQSNPRARRAYDLEQARLQENEEEDDDLDTPLPPRLPQHQTHGSASSGGSSASSSSSTAAENRITRWPSVAPLRVGNPSSSTATLASPLPIVPRRQATLLPGSATTGNLGTSAGGLAQRRGQHRRRGMTINLAATTMSSSSGRSSSSGTIAAAASTTHHEGSSSVPSTPCYGPAPFPAPTYPPPGIPSRSRGGSGDSAASASSAPKTPQEKIVELDEFFATWGS
ncbi:hypothetical protein V8F33_001745 [Rhypophila sp. PSN 637]